MHLANWIEVEHNPYDIVTRNFQLPFGPYPFQAESITQLAPRERSGLYFDPGLGKTYTSTVCGLYKLAMGWIDQILVVFPPILDATWRKTLHLIHHKAGPSLRIESYKGSPSERRKMHLNADIVLMSQGIFKRDYDRIVNTMGTRRLFVILDEAQSIKNVGSDNHQTFREFTHDQQFQILTGTPLTTPMDGYAYVKLLAPEVYRSLAQFKRIHVEEYDFYDRPSVWTNTDLLRDNMAINAVFVRKRDVLKDLPDRNIFKLEYELDRKHLALYHKLVEDKLLALPDGGKIDATQATALRHALGQVVMNWAHFSGDDKKVPAGMDLIEETLEEIGDGKLLVFANYRMTNRAICAKFEKKYGAVGVFGDVSPKQKDRNVARFLTDSSCRLAALQPQSGGVGIDGMQDVASEVLFIEPPITPKDLDQSLSRVWRAGQKNICNIRLGVAENTLQVKGVEDLIEKEEVVNPIQYNKAELREMLYGK